MDTVLRFLEPLHRIPKSCSRRCRKKLRKARPQSKTGSVLRGLDTENLIGSSREFTDLEQFALRLFRRTPQQQSCETYRHWRTPANKTAVRPRLALLQKQLQRFRPEAITFRVSGCSRSLAYENASNMRPRRRVRAHVQERDVGGEASQSLGSPTYLVVQFPAARAGLDRKHDEFGFGNVFCTNATHLEIGGDPVRGFFPALDTRCRRSKTQIIRG